MAKHMLVLRKAQPPLLGLLLGGDWVFCDLLASIQSRSVRLHSTRTGSDLGLTSERNRKDLALANNMYYKAIHNLKHLCVYPALSEKGPGIWRRTIQRRLTKPQNWIAFIFTEMGFYALLRPWLMHCDTVLGSC